MAHPMRPAHIDRTALFRISFCRILVLTLCIGGSLGAQAVASNAGVLTTSDGREIRIRYEDLTITGTARFVWHDGRSYSGDFVDGQPQGHGVEQYPDGSNYDGNWEGGRRNGIGSYNRPDGSNYTGDWRNDMPNGFGRFVDPDSYTYVGAWRAGQRSGYGAMKIGDTFGYEGTWAANVRQGYGRELRPDGSEYVGEWRDDQRNGNGVLTAPDGASHDGNWAHDAPAGRGTRISAEGIAMSGSWDGDLISNGSVKLPRGASYSGKLYDPNVTSVDAAFRAWLERVANQGDADAALLLGQVYRFFKQPTPDRAKSISWYARAAEGGLAEAQYQLAQMLFEDSATSQRAMRLLTAAAAQGHTGANARLGVFYQLGTYVEKNRARAQHFYEIAIKGGDLNARNNLAWLLATSPSADLRNGKRAVALARPLAVFYGSWGYLDTLAAAQAEAGEFAAAARTERKAIMRATSGADPAALQDLEHRLTLFEHDQPYREP